MKTIYLSGISILLHGGVFLCIFRYCDSSLLLLMLLMLFVFLVFLMFLFLLFFLFLSSSIKVRVLQNKNTFLIRIMLVSINNHCESSEIVCQ